LRIISQIFALDSEVPLFNTLDQGELLNPELWNLASKK